MQSYDLVVVGSGPAGQKAAVQAAKLSKRVAIIEKAPQLGGTSLNTGTLPSKTLKDTIRHDRVHSRIGAARIAPTGRRTHQAADAPGPDGAQRPGHRD